MLDTLVELDWAGRLDEGGAQRFALLVDPRTTRAAPLLERTLVTAIGPTRGLWSRAGLGDLLLSELLQMG
jgi:membrane protein